MMEAGEDADRHENFPALHEIKAIIIGSKAEYKCSAAKTIFGQNDCKGREEIVKSDMKQNTVQNRSVTLVMTPGWWRSFTLAESAKYLKMEIVHSLKLCPDPHAFLLVINLHKPFTNMHLNSVVEHMEILGEQIWNHTIVLLMYDDKEQRNADSKQLIERAGTELDILIQKCGNRVHVFNYTHSRGINVQKLFHEMVAQHEGQSFKTDSKLFEGMEEKRQNVKEQAEERSIQIKTKMQNLNERLTEKFSPELRIVLMGGNNGHQDLMQFCWFCSLVLPSLKHIRGLSRSTWSSWDEMSGSTVYGLKTQKLCLTTGPYQNCQDVTQNEDH